jgi:hypothetical protein
MDNTNLLNSIDNLGKDIIADITKRLLDADKKATGNLINSLSYEVLQTVDGIMLRILTADYFKYVDEGRKPGSKQPPTSSILPWIQSKGISFISKNGAMVKPESMAFVIAKSIGEKGIKPLNIKDNVINDILNKKQDILMNSISIDVSDFIKNNLIDISI